MNLRRIMAVISKMQRLNLDRFMAGVVLHPGHSAGESVRDDKDYLYGI